MFTSLHFNCRIIKCVLFALLSVLTIQPQALAQPVNFSLILGCADPASLNDTTELPENFVPICSDIDQVKYLRVAIHFLLPGGIVEKTISDCDGNPGTPFYYTGYGNFTENGDGFTSSGYNGYKRAEDIIGIANMMLDSNRTQWRKATDTLVQNPPLNITYPVTPPTVPMRYLLTGVYFHRDEEAYLAIEPDSTNIKYGVDRENTINVYYTPHGNWTGNAFVVGGPSKFIFCNEYFIYVQPTCRDWSLTFSGHNLNHEVGHTTGLDHTWNLEDECDDTPQGFRYDEWENNICTQNRRANCWKLDASISTCPSSNGGKPCDEWYKISNNIMDYNSNWYHAFTLCQTERINNDLAGLGNPFIHSCDGCAPAIAFFHMNDTVRLCLSAPNSNGVVVMQAEASTNEDKYKIDICQVSPSDPTNCTSGWYNTGWLNGSIGILDLSTLYNFQPDRYYKINLTVNNTECPTSSSYEKIIHTIPCNPDTTLSEGGNTGLRLSASNPINDYIHVFYETDRDGLLSFQLINIFSSQPSVLMQETYFTTGSYYQSFSTNTLPSGTYLLRASFNYNVTDKTIIKP